MSEHRRPTIPFTDAPRGVCRWCGEDILFESGMKKGTQDRRRRWHPTCVATYNATDPREARRRIRRRDRGRCATCRVDTYQVRRELKKIRRGRAKATRARGYKPGQSFWELDHIVPLVDGGTHGDDNLQTLCTPCHKRKTAEEASARAERIREARSSSASWPDPDAFEPEIVIRGQPIRRAKGPEDLDGLFGAADSLNARVADILAKGFRAGS